MEMIDEYPTSPQKRQSKRIVSFAPQQITNGGSVTAGNTPLSAIPDNNNDNEYIPPPPPPPNLRDSKSQSLPQSSLSENVMSDQTGYHTAHTQQRSDNRYNHIPPIRARPQSATHRSSHHFPLKNRYGPGQNAQNQQQQALLPGGQPQFAPLKHSTSNNPYMGRNSYTPQPTHNTEQELPAWNTSNSHGTPRRRDTYGHPPTPQQQYISNDGPPNAMRRQKSQPMPLSNRSSNTSRPSPQQYAMGLTQNNNVAAPPPPPIQIDAKQKSVPIALENHQSDSVAYMNNNNHSHQTDDMMKNNNTYSYDDKQNIKPPNPADSANSLQQRQRKAVSKGLTKSEFFAKYLIDAKIIGQLICSQK